MIICISAKRDWWTLQENSMLFPKRKSSEKFRPNFQKNEFLLTPFFTDCKMIVGIAGESALHFLHTNMIFAKFYFFKT